MGTIRIIFMALVMALKILSSEGQLVENFYISSCPNVELLVSQAVTNKFTQTITTGQATLRLFLHDCFVEVFIHLINFHNT
jgi:peroxidase